MCVDLSHLNRYVKRERYKSATPAQAVADITAEVTKNFTKLDAAKKGYHQCPLYEGSQDLTTFITHFGWFKFLRTTYGISSISSSRMDEAFDGLLGFRSCRQRRYLQQRPRPAHSTSGSSSSIVRKTKSL